MKATAVSVREDAAGTALAANLALTDLTVKVVSARDFPTTGACQVGSHSLAYTGILYADEPTDAVTVDTLQLAAGSTATGTALTTVVQVAGSVEYVAQVRPQGTDGLLDAVLDPKLAADKTLAPSSLTGALVECQWRGRGSARRLWLVNIIGRAPSIDGARIAPGTTMAAALDSSDPGFTAFIGGFIGGMGGSSSNIGGGEWGDTYSSTSVHGGEWGDTYA